MAGGELCRRLSGLPGARECTTTEHSVVITAAAGTDARLLKARAQVVCADAGEPRRVEVRIAPLPPPPPALPMPRGGVLAGLDRPLAVVTVSVLALVAIGLMPGSSNLPRRAQVASAPPARPTAEPPSTAAAAPSAASTTPGPGGASLGTSSDSGADGPAPTVAAPAPTVAPQPVSQRPTLAGGVQPAFFPGSAVVSSAGTGAGPVAVPVAGTGGAEALGSTGVTAASTGAQALPAPAVAPAPALEVERPPARAGVERAVKAERAAKTEAPRPTEKADVSRPAEKPERAERAETAGKGGERRG